MPDYAAIQALAERARARIREVSPQEAARLRGEGALFIDVRDEDELLRNPPIAGAVHFSRGQLEYRISDAASGHDELLVLYCAGGNRGALASASLQELGYTRVVNLAGGLMAWNLAHGRPWHHPPGHDADTLPPIGHD